MMPYERLRHEGRIHPHHTNPQEIANLFAVIERDLADAAIQGLSTDRRFATAYNAALQAAMVVLYCEGYRTTGLAHHATAFEFVRMALGPSVGPLMDYFDHCRTRRSRVEYERVEHVSETETAHLLAEARVFRDTVRAWIERVHPELVL
ncbi:MAG: SAV_6107 family HEPN domain-containing protein [Chloroflexota bacterium]